MRKRCADSKRNSAGASMVIRAPREVINSTTPALRRWVSFRIDLPFASSSDPASFTTVAITRCEVCHQRPPPMSKATPAAVAVRWRREVQPVQRGLSAGTSSGALARACRVFCRAGHGGAGVWAAWIIPIILISAKHSCRNASSSRKRVSKRPRSGSGTSAPPVQAWRKISRSSFMRGSPWSGSRAAVGWRGNGADRPRESWSAVAPPGSPAGRR